jgi:23S rRNA-/tRNA-specific pseudouridylate synthase
VIDKPPGWLCVPGRSPGTPVLIDWVRSTLGEAWVCHRLDLETSGVWLVARTASFHKLAGSWFEQHRMRKQYRFIADGLPGLPVLRLDAPIEGQRSVTQIEVLEVWKAAQAFLGVARPQSGRRHQIRIHLSQAGHPIWGDRRYASSRTEIARTALHASVLELPDGRRFESPLPADFEQACRRGRGE